MAKTPPHLNPVIPAAHVHSKEFWAFLAVYRSWRHRLSTACKLEASEGCSDCVTQIRVTRLGLHFHTIDSLSLAQTNCLFLFQGFWEGCRADTSLSQHVKLTRSSVLAHRFKFFVVPLHLWPSLRCGTAPVQKAQSQIPYWSLFYAKQNFHINFCTQISPALLIPALHFAVQFQTQLKGENPKNPKIKNHFLHIPLSSCHRGNASEVINSSTYSDARAPASQIWALLLCSASPGQS